MLLGGGYVTRGHRRWDRTPSKLPSAEGLSPRSPCLHISHQARFCLEVWLSVIAQCWLGLGPSPQRGWYWELRPNPFTGPAWRDCLSPVAIMVRS